MAPLRPLRYSNDCPELPASAPVNHPHLIDVTNWDETKIDMRSLRFCDGFFTLMYKWKPCAVDLFLNWNSPVSLVFTRKPKETSDWARDLVVIKKGNRAEVRPLCLPYPVSECWDPPRKIDPVWVPLS